MVDWRKTVPRLMVKAAIRICGGTIPALDAMMALTRERGYVNEYFGVNCGRCSLLEFCARCPEFRRLYGVAYKK